MRVEDQRRSPAATRLRLCAGETPLWLCFEPWAGEYLVPAHGSVMVDIDTEGPIEIEHRPDGIVFYTTGRHPDVWSVDGRPLALFSDHMPAIPEARADGPIGFARDITAALPVARSLFPEDGPETPPKAGPAKGGPNSATDAGTSGGTGGTGGTGSP